ncbi:MAG: peptidase MA family metallohydrolase [Planctomycetota bacterium]|nr:peptidase MA family metallohydrolase [Planctomycetota bacterium]
MSYRTYALPGSLRPQSPRPRRFEPAAVLAALWLAAVPALAAPSSSTFRHEPRAASSAGAQDEAEAELAEERAALDRSRRLGDKSALAELSQWVEDEPGDVATRALYARALRDVGRWVDAAKQASKAFEDGAQAKREVRAQAARVWLEILIDLGDPKALAGAVKATESVLKPDEDARDAWLVGRARWTLGLGGEARDAWSLSARDRTRDWERLLSRARSARALGDLIGASKALVDAEEATGTAREPDVLAELASVYFEADGEIDHQQANKRAPGPTYRAALALNKTHGPSLLGLFELGRFNWNRQQTPAHEWLGQLLTAVPDSLDGLCASASADLDDGKLPDVRSTLARLDRLAPQRRDVRTLHAALAWVEHRRDEAERILSELAASHAADATPERELARHLCELYRFAEAVPFARRAVERDPQDARAFLELGHALSNTCDEAGGLAALQRSQELAAGRQNAWRHNTVKVLEAMQKRFVVEKGDGELRYAWTPDSADVLRTYWMPFYFSSRAELSQRYGHTPGPVVIEVFDRFQDFSVRSTGFEGFPALGVCFGPVVTSVAPQSELRGRFSWARTSFHEFTHVVHLGLSHNRCPRWITEGLATWEEENHNASWTRNMRRDLLDAWWNKDLIRVRDLNRAFRSSRILFGYFMSGQLCRMLIEEQGFAPMVKLLEAFDRGDDLDRAIQGTFGMTPEQLDARFDAWVQRAVEPLRIEPRWNAARTTALKFELDEKPPKEAEAARRWAEGWTSVAWGYFQQGRKIDAEQALRKLALVGELPPRALFLQGAVAAERNDNVAAKELYERGLAAGGEDYRIRIVLGEMAEADEDVEEAEKQYLAAERAYPGFPEEELSAELRLAKLYEREDREDERFAALERWIRWESDNYGVRMRLAEHHAEAGRHERAVELYVQANEIDPFRRKLHRNWATSLVELGRHSEAAREWRVTRLVPPALDPEDGEPLADKARAELLGREALALFEAGDREAAKARADEALALDDGEDHAEEVLERLAKGS